MSIELKEAAQQAIEAIQDLRGYRPDIDKAIEALRTAIQQVEAKTDEPVAWGWAIVDNKGLERRTRARLQDFFGSNQEAKPFSLEDVAREDREFAGCAPHRVITLFTRSAPGVPDDDVVRDADRLNWLARNPVDAIDVFGKSRPDEARFIRATIDAAMLTAAQAQKGQP